MTKNKILIASILLVISANAFAFLFVPTLVSAMRTVITNPALQTAAKSAWSSATSAKVALYLGLPTALGFGSSNALIFEGLNNESVDVYPDGFTYYSPNKYGYTTGTGTVYTDWKIKMVFVSASAGCSVSSVYADTLAHRSTLNSWYGGYTPVGSAPGDYMLGSEVHRVSESGAVCKSGDSISTPDFSTPIEIQTPILSDSNGDYYMSGSDRVPAVPVSLDQARQAYLDETGQDYDFMDGAWSSAQDLLSDTYKGLTLDEGIQRANYIKTGVYDTDPSYDWEVIINSDFLPERTDWESPHVQAIEGDDTNVIVHNYDSQGNYIDTTLDTYANLKLMEDGVQTSNTSEFDSRTSYVEPSLVGTTTTPGVTQVLAPESTYTGLDALTNSTQTISDNIAKTSSDSTDDLLSKLLGVNTKTKSNTSAISTNTAQINSFLRETADTSIAVDPVDSFMSSIPTDADMKTSIQDALTLNQAVFDMESNQVQSSFFNNVACYNIVPALDYEGGTYTVSDFWAFKICDLLDFIGVFFVFMATFASFFIVFQGIGRIH